MDAPIRPVGTNILVLRDEAQQKVGSIILPDSAQTAPRRGEVIALGRRVGCAPTEPASQKAGQAFLSEVKVGDGVMFKPHCGFECPIDGEDYLVLDQNDILGVLQHEHA